MRSFDTENIPRLLLSKEESGAFVEFLSCNQELSLDIEIGCGVGLHPLEYIHLTSGRKIIAIERTQAKFKKFINRFNSHLKKKPDLGAVLLPVGGEAISFLLEFIKASTVENYFLLHPNPYPKARHLNKRWYAMPAMSLLVSTLKSGGCITLATNQKYYYQEALVYMQELWKFSIKDQSIYYKGDIKGRTHFERKYLDRGEAIFNVVFQKPMLGS